jgi:hypothetical protein
MRVPPISVYRSQYQQFCIQVKRVFAQKLKRGKAARKMLVKLTPGIDILCAAFMHESLERSFLCLQFRFELFLAQES